MEDKALVYLEDVTLCMEENIVLRNVSLTLHNGEFVYVIGKVGSGKSSLLKALYSEIRVSEGEATVMGYDMCNMRRRDIPYLRRKLGIIFQSRGFRSCVRRALSLRAHDGRGRERTPAPPACYAPPSGSAARRGRRK